jgi:FKBP-type peptidyl-prolyl cis-trans isomerase 2
MIQNGNVIDVHYTGKLTDGSVFDSSEGREPLRFQVGSGQIIPGFENAIIGKNIGDKVTVTISPDEAYGQEQEELFVKIPNDKLPGKVEVGQVLEATSEDGRSSQVRVHEVNEDHCVINGNHPLAGQELVFDIEVVSID